MKKPAQELKQLIGSQIRKAHLLNGWTQQGLAEELQTAGFSRCSRSLLAKIESGDVALRCFEIFYFSQGVRETLREGFLENLLRRETEGTSARQAFLVAPKELPMNKKTSPTPRNILGPLFKRLRVESGLSQYHVANRFTEIGYRCTPARISRIEERRGFIRFDDILIFEAIFPGLHSEMLEVIRQEATKKVN